MHRCGNGDEIFLKGFRPGPARGFLIQLAQTKVISKTNQIFSKNLMPAVPNCGNLCIFDALDILCQPSDAVHHRLQMGHWKHHNIKKISSGPKFIKLTLSYIFFIFFQLANMVQYELFLYSHYFSFAFKPSTIKKIEPHPHVQILLLLKASFIIQISRVLKEVSMQEAKGKRLSCRVHIMHF